MITREELFDKIQREIAIEYCFSDLVEIIESGAVKSVFDKTYDSLKVQLANTEQLTCQDCSYKIEYGYSLMCDTCSVCRTNNFYPKDTHSELLELCK